MGLEKIIGANISWLLWINKESQSDLAKAIGASETTIFHYISGRNKPHIEQLIKIAKHYGVTVDDIVTMQTRLSPCPFCGAKANVVKDGEHNFVIDAKHEEGCYLYYHKILFTSEDEASTAWNRRWNQ